MGQEPRKLTKFEASGLLDRGLFIVVAATLLFTITLLTFSLVFQYENYSKGIAAALSGAAVEDDAAILAYARGWDFAVAKTASIFLAFSLVFVGALYVLRAARVWTHSVTQ
jgi:uncharacterized membrane protein YadS